MKLQSLLPAFGLLVFVVPPILANRKSPVRIPPRRENKTIQHCYHQMPSLPRELYTQTSTDVVRARVKSLTPSFAQEPPCTIADIEVTWSLKGTLASATNIILPGAEDDTRQFISHPAANLLINDDALLFLLEDSDSGTIAVLGLNEGIYRVHTADDGLEYVNGKGADEELLTSWVTALADEWLTVGDRN